MASKEDKLLAALRSLSPPRGGAGGPSEEEPDAPQAKQADGDDVPARRHRRTVELSLEEIGVFFLAAVVLVVLAFLMGWYGRGIASRERPAGDVRGRVPLLSVEERAVRDLGVHPGGIRPSPAPRLVFAILAARFPSGGATDAEDYRALLEEHGLVPAFLRRTEEKIELCVGEFASKRDPVLLKWLPRVRALREIFAGAQVVRIPERRSGP